MPDVRYPRVARKSQHWEAKTLTVLLAVKAVLVIEGAATRTDDAKQRS